MKTIRILLALILAACAATPPPAAGPAWGALCFVLAMQGNSDIYLLDSSGARRQLTFGKDYDGQPAVSPDGRTLAFVSKQKGEEAIYACEIRDGVPWKVYAGGIEPAWSPDGKQLAFITYVDRNHELAVIRADGTGFRRLTLNRATEGQPAWSPDGKEIAYVTNLHDSNGFDICAIRVESGEIRRVVSNGRSNSSPSWSPDGQFLAYGSGGEIYVCRSDGTEPKQLTDDAYPDCQPRWSPEGRAISYCSPRNGRNEIHIIDPETKASFRILEGVWEQQTSWVPSSGRDGFMRCDGAVQDERVKDVWEVLIQIGNGETLDIDNSLSAYDGRLYLAASNGVACFDQESGKKHWHFRSVASFVASPICALGQLYVVDVEGTVSCLDSKSGEKLWHSVLGKGVDSAVGIQGRHLCVGTLDGHVIALHSLSGNKVWDFSTGSAVRGPLTVRSGRVFIGDESGAVTCLNATDGKLIWKFQTGKPVRSGCVESEGRIYFSADVEFFCLSSDQGHEIWRVKGETPWGGTPSVYQNRVYAGSTFARLYCLNGKTGKIEWEFHCGNLIQSSPCVWGPYVVLTCPESQLIGVDRETGKERFRRGLGEVKRSSPVVERSRLFVADMSSRLRCYEWNGPNDRSWPELGGWGRRINFGLLGRERVYRNDRRRDSLHVVVETKSESKATITFDQELTPWGRTLELFWDVDGLKLLSPGFSPPDSREIRELFELLSSDRVDQRHEAVSKLARRYYECRKQIDALLESSSDPDVKERGRDVRRSAEPFAPILMKFPLTNQSEWSNAYEWKFKVVGREVIQGFAPAWKVQFSAGSDVSIIWWWSEDYDLPIAMQLGDDRWVLDPH